MTETAVPISTLPLIPSFSKLTKENEINIYWNKLISDWMLPKHVNHFPGSHPISLERKNLPFLKKKEGDFLVSLKSDGVRYILYMTLRPNTETPVCFLIDRSKNMYEIEVWAPEDYYKGTIIDGELLWNLSCDNTTTFLAFDVVKYKGIMCTKNSYSERLKILEQIILEEQCDTKEEVESIIEEKDKIVSMNNLYNMKLKAKMFTPLNMLYKLWEDRNTTCYRHDGLIFTKNMDEYKHGSAKNSVFKWKPYYSIDVIVKTGLIYANSKDSEDLVKCETILGRNLVLLENKINFKNSDVLECDVRKEGNSFYLFPMRVRLDKKFPNTIQTIESSCTGLLDNVTIDELCQLF